MTIKRGVFSLFIEVYYTKLLRIKKGILSQSLSQIFQQLRNSEVGISEVLSAIPLAH